MGLSYKYRIGLILAIFRPFFYFLGAHPAHANFFLWFLCFLGFDKYICGFGLNGFWKNGLIARSHTEVKYKIWGTKY